LLHLTGHTGTLDDGSLATNVEDQIRQTFRNVALTLAEVGVGWDRVIGITTYHLDLRSQADALLVVASEFLAAPYPAWSAVGVTGLIEEDALVEMSCVARVVE
jgi:enamine deaminase RidA (YjgF/YER057c/UK114 family)